MKTKLNILALILLSLSACKKEQNIQNTKGADTRPAEDIITLSRTEAKAYLGQLIKEQPDSTTAIRNIRVHWETAANSPSPKGNTWKIRLQGQPVYQNVKQGYRQLAIRKNPNTKALEARILEIIPDAIYLQKGTNINSKTFTGRVFSYDLNYRLKNGQIYSEGKQVGQIATTEKLTTQPGQRLKDLNPPKGQQGKTMTIQFTESCTWLQDSYVNANGEFTVHAELICSYTSYDDGMSWSSGDGGNTTNSTSLPSGGGGGGQVSPDPTPPAPSNLPGENNSKVDPEKMMDCFSQITDPNAAFTIRIYVVEPQPGTFFNVGQNAFGHVAISLSKTSGTTTITQTIGFYPTGTGLEKLDSKSQILDNGLGEYNISSTYYVNSENFQKVINYVSSPPAQYHFTDFNCSAFVYAAGQAGNLPIPDPTTQIGLGGPGGVSTAKTPAGMASALREQKAANPNLDINEGGGKMPESKGPCN